MAHYYQRGQFTAITPDDCYDGSFQSPINFNLSRRWLSTIYEGDNEQDEDSDHEQRNEDRSSNHINCCRLSSPSSWCRSKRLKETVTNEQNDDGKSLLSGPSPAFNILRKAHVGFVSPRKTVVNPSDSKQSHSSSPKHTSNRIGAKTFLRSFSFFTFNQSKQQQSQLQLPIPRRCEQPPILHPVSLQSPLSSPTADPPCCLPSCCSVPQRQQTLQSKVRQLISTRPTSKSVNHRPVIAKGLSPSIHNQSRSPLSYANSTGSGRGSFSPTSPFSCIVKGYSVDRRGRRVRYPFFGLQTLPEERSAIVRHTKPQRPLQHFPPNHRRHRHGHSSSSSSSGSNVPWEVLLPQLQQQRKRGGLKRGK